MTDPKIVELPSPRNRLYHLAGALILAANKLRHDLSGYKTPRTFPISQITRAIEYDYRVANQWINAYSRYTGHPKTLEDRTILELGPGADLGIGLITLSMGARKYNALDVNNLVADVPPDFYEALFAAMERKGTSEQVILELRQELEKTLSRNNDRLNYVVRDDFDISIFKEEGIDTIFSQAAFEHFEDIPRTFSLLGDIVTDSAVLIAEVDLSTHTRWIRDVDPLNIYRFSDAYYDMMKFRGSPNRLTATDYHDALADAGWQDIRITPLIKVSDNYLAHIKPRLAPRFSRCGDQIGYLSILIHARRS